MSTGPYTDDTADIAEDLAGVVLHAAGTGEITQARLAFLIQRRLDKLVEQGTLVVRTTAQLAAQRGG